MNSDRTIAGSFGAPAVCASEAVAIDARAITRAASHAAAVKNRIPVSFRAFQPVWPARRAAHDDTDVSSRQARVAVIRAPTFGSANVAVSSNERLRRRRGSWLRGWSE